MSVWIGRFDKEGGGQSEAAWTRDESSPAGVIGWSGPPGERSLSFPLVLRLTHALSCSGSLLLFGACGSRRGPGGAELQRESLQGPYRRRGGSRIQAGSFQQTRACKRTRWTFVFRVCASVSLFHSKEERKKRGVCLNIKSLRLLNSSAST